MRWQLLNDADGDGVCDEFEVLGCTDSSACNYDADATDVTAHVPRKTSAVFAEEMALLKVLVTAKAMVLQRVTIAMATAWLAPMETACATI